MRVPLGHPWALMAEKVLCGREIVRPHDVVAGEGVAEIVEAEITEARQCNRKSEAAM